MFIVTISQQVAVECFEEGTFSGRQLVRMDEKVLVVLAPLTLLRPRHSSHLFSNKFFFDDIFKNRGEIPVT